MDTGPGDHKTSDLPEKREPVQEQTNSSSARNKSG